ncbi:unnamed protein product [Closterium sp. Yama58-4]|nr:unnamed protein product [Closterium sp. Yama58-4]
MQVFYVMDEQGEPVKAVPCFFGYPGDFIEQCRATATLQTGTKRPCCTCYIPDILLPDLVHRATTRTVDSEMHVLRNMLACKTVKEAEAIQTEWSFHPVECVLSRWNFSDTSWGNLFGACVEDIMHVLDSGLALYMLESHITTLTEGDAAMATYRSALGDLMDALQGSMVAAQITASEIVAHTEVAIPHKEDWYAKVLCIFKVATATGEQKAFLYVQYYEEAGQCPLTTCLQLTPSRKDTRYAVVAVESILRVVHICRSYSNPGVLLLKKILLCE